MTASEAGEEFRDPLSNYDPPAYADDLEQALAESPMSVVEGQPFATIPPDTPVADAVHRLATLEIACLIVEEAGRLVGVFTERDVLDKVVADYGAVKDRPVRDIMTTNPVTVRSNDPPAKALFLMAATAIRHVPILDESERIIGIVSPRRVTSFLTSFLVEG